MTIKRSTGNTPPKKQTAKKAAAKKSMKSAPQKGIDMQGSAAKAGRKHDGGEDGGLSLSGKGKK